jgi:hypothetical protein
LLLLGLIFLIHGLRVLRPIFLPLSLYSLSLISKLLGFALEGIIIFNAAWMYNYVPDVEQKPPALTSG